MKRIAITFLIIFITGNFSFAQNQGINNIWLSGYNGGFGETKMDFYSGTPVISQYNVPMDFEHTFADISDTAGNLLFYTNGYYIADAGNDTMQNGSGINPSAYTSYASEGLFIPQEDLILNRIGNDSLFDMFHGTLDNWPNATDVLSFYLYHSVINMNLNALLGAVTLKNDIVINDSLVPGKIVACKHANGQDWWITLFRSHSNKIYKILLLNNGVYFVSSQNIGLTRANFYGQAKFTPDGKKFVVYNPQFASNAYFEIFDFDRCNGQFNNPLTVVLPPNITFNAGLEFSPNSQFLYITTGDSIFQFDVTSANIAASKITVAARDTFYQPGFPGLVTGLGLPQLAPDGKIYITTGNSTTYYGTIDNPDTQGMGCNVSQHSVLLPTYNYNTIPNHPNYFLGCDTIGGCTCLVGTPHLNPPRGGGLLASPNPTNGIFTLQFPVSSTAGTLEIFDRMGNLVRKDYVAPWSQFKKTDISHLSAGIYFCKIKWAKSEASLKIIKE